MSFGEESRSVAQALVAVATARRYVNVASFVQIHDIIQITKTSTGLAVEEVLTQTASRASARG